MLTIRDGRRVWPYCSECGCRLEIFENDVFLTFRHFGSSENLDARGCLCSRISLEWSIDKGLRSHFGYC